MPQRGFRLSDERERAISHLHYEAEMLVGTAKLLHKGRFPAGTLHNAILESFVIHARALVHFLYPLNPYPTDILADDFFRDPTVWTEARPSLPSAVESIRKRVNKEVAHLTWERIEIDDESRSWDHGEIADAIVPVFSLFVNLAMKADAAEAGSEEKD